MSEGPSTGPDGLPATPEAGPAPPDEAAALRAALEQQRAIARRTAIEAEETARKLRETRERLAATRDRLNVLQGRRSIRITLAVARAGRSAVRRARAVARRMDPRRALADRTARRRLTAGPAEERRFVDAVRRQTAGPAPETGPLVTIVMLNRDGEEHLRRVLPALAATAYRDVELVVVDNGSTDGSLAVLEAFRPSFPVRIVRNPENASFSTGNNQGLAAASGELILFLNNDIEPIGPEWLGHLVSTLQESGVVAVGARLIYPRRSGAVRAGLRFRDLSLQHAGVDFAWLDGIPMPRPIGVGEDALAGTAAAVRDVPALTAACLLVRRSDLEAVEGFADGYDYGLEDVDLCLRLRERGRLVYDGRAALWHHESASRILDEAATRRTRIEANRERFVGTWGPRLFRTVLLDAVHGERTLRSGPPELAIDGTGDDADPRTIVESLRSAGWSVRALDPTAPLESAPEILLALDPARDVRTTVVGVRIAWVGGDLDRWLAIPWFDDYDLVIAGDPVIAERIQAASAQRALALDRATGAAFLAAVEAWSATAHYGIRVGIPSWDVAASWGDLHFARGLQRAIRRLGHPAMIRIRPEWMTGSDARDDVTVHLFGMAEAPTRPGQLNVLWQISHPDRASVALYDRYDRVFVASDGFAERMRSLVTVPVLSLHQATDPDRYRPEPTGPVHELLLVANSRGVRRHVLEDLLPTDHELAVYGRAWTAERLDPRYLAGDHVPNADLGGYYAAAKIVLSDHWLDMQREGFLSNRLYDAAAAGGFVISDTVEGLEAEFDGGVVAYRDAAHLRDLIEHYLAHPEERRIRADRARNAVLARHTFDHRARDLVEAIEPALAERPRAV